MQNLIADYEAPQFLCHPEHLTDSLCTLCLDIVRVNDRFATLERAQRAHLCRAEEVIPPVLRRKVISIDQHSGFGHPRHALLRTATR